MVGTNGHLCVYGLGSVASGGVASLTNMEAVDHGRPVSRAQKKGMPLISRYRVRVPLSGCPMGDNLSEYGRVLHSVCLRCIPAPKMGFDTVSYLAQRRYGFQVYASITNKFRE